MSTISDSSGSAHRRELELAVGVELNALLSASRSLTERAAAVFHPDLQPAAFHLARWLFAYGPVKPSALAEAVGMDRSSTSALLGRMKALGLAESQPDRSDRRATVISLTELGEKSVEEALDLRGSAFFQRTREWSDDQLATFAELLGRFAREPVPS